jgi:hypothetical protein
LFECNLWEAAGRFLDVSHPAVKGMNVEACFAKNLRKKANAATGIQRGSKIENLLQLVDHAADSLTAGLN